MNTVPFGLIIQEEKKKKKVLSATPEQDQGAAGHDGRAALPHGGTAAPRQL